MDIENIIKHGHSKHLTLSEIKKYQNITKMRIICK